MNYDICVFGGCSLDMMFYGKEDGTFSEIPDKMVPGGKAANQAVSASRAGAKVTIITRIGKDRVGEKIIDNLEYNEVITSNVELIEGLENDCAKIYIDHITKDNEIIRTTNASDSFTPQMVERYKDVLLASKIILAQLKIPKSVTEKLINFCYENDKILILTPCRAHKLNINEANNKDLLDKITYITCNEKECKKLFNTNSIEECVTMYPNKLIVTLGSEGVMYHDGENIIKLPSITVTGIKDTTGAGDTFNGHLAYGILCKLPLDEAIERAQYAAAMKITSATAQQGMPFRQELDNYID